MVIINMKNGSVTVRDGGEIRTIDVAEAARDLGISKEAYLDIIRQTESYDRNARGYERVGR